MKMQGNWTLKISTLVVVTACYFVLVSAVLISQNLGRTLSLWGEDVQMTIYLSEGVTAHQAELMSKDIQKWHGVESVQYINQEKALQDFKTQMASYAPDLSRDDELLRLIPSSLLLKLNKDLPAAEQLQTLQSIASKLKNKEGIEDVSFGQEWVQKYATLINTIENVFQILGLILICAVIFVISNSVRASVSTRREDIAILEMIGASALMIRKPYIVEGATMGFVASGFSIVLSFILFVGTKEVISEKLSFLKLSEALSYFHWYEILCFLLVGLLVGALASYLCVRKVNTGFAGSRALS